jgi:hypothetical protein
MTNLAVTRTEGARTTSSPQRDWKLDFFLVFLCLALVELVAFGINAKSVGVYQDEWIAFGQLHFLPHNLTSLLSALLNDPRYVVRPVTVFHYAPLFLLVWEKPLWYHIICYVSEFFGGFFLFLAVNKLCRNQLIGLAAAVLFLLYPTHDATHYYITASSEQISASFFTLCLWLFAKGVMDRKVSFVLWSSFAYFWSLYTYEQTLPLLVLFPALTLLLLPRTKNIADYARRVAWYQAPFFAVALSLVFYRSWLLPHLGLGWHYSTCYSVSNALAVMLAGINCSFSPYLLQFCFKMAGDLLASGLSIFQWCALSATAVAVCLCAFKCNAETQDNNPGESRPTVTPFALIALGALTIFLSYTIFCISPEHMPVVDMWRNRVNICGALGASFVLAGLLGLLQACGKTILARQVVPALLVAATGAFLILVDWQFAVPWIVSWQSQKQLMSMVHSHASEIKPGDSLILGGMSRYVRWAPVADGVWDFQNLVRTTLNTQSVNANVVTPRLHVEKDALVDRSGILVLGTYPYKQMILYAPDKASWVRIASRDEFLAKAQQFGWTFTGEQSLGSPASSRR